MLCEQCAQREATTHVRRILHGEVEEHHLCGDCARQGGYTAHALSDFGFQLSDLFGGFLGSSPALTHRLSEPPRRCPVCGCSLQDIAREGKVGCAECYRVFYEQLRPTLKRIHGAVQHGGKQLRPAPEQEAARQREEALQRLRADIAAAVQAEQYEEAARLRDEIRTLENGGEQA
ncbi:MAG: UvrB/UvrC motif-containing protein [Oscillospiraceae bacterium]|jgi:protein arginine kinase activator|nr:UvrB/UvrC motif-containing protein [Oscillospiraceae bacterium]